MGTLFVESIKRLYKDNKISKDKVLELYGSKKISEDELNAILKVKSDVE